MNSFLIEQNAFLNKTLKAFYDLDYIGFGQVGNPDFINVLKNTFNKESDVNIKSAANECYGYIYNFLKSISLPYWAIKYPYYVCAVPRSKADFSTNQLIFRDVIRVALENLNRSELKNGLNFINRHTSVKTTHIKNDMGWNTGDLPYPGITNNTCNLSAEIKGKNIILIDDIYTKTVNVIEDCAQALLTCGARDIIVYTVARTAYKGNK